MPFSVMDSITREKPCASPSRKSPRIHNTNHALHSYATSKSLDSHLDPIICNLDILVKVPKPQFPQEYAS